MRPENRPLDLATWTLAIRDRIVSCFGGAVGTKIGFREGEARKWTPQGQTTFEELPFQKEQTSGNIAGGGVDSRGDFSQMGETRHVGMLMGTAHWGKESMVRGHKSGWSLTLRKAGRGEDLAPRGKSPSCLEEQAVHRGSWVGGCGGGNLSNCPVSASVL